jgi:hypothetical protein
LGCQRKAWWQCNGRMEFAFHMYLPHMCHMYPYVPAN